MGSGLSLANKCLVIFGAVIVLIIAFALSVPWIRTSTLVQEYQLEVARQLADAWLEARIEFGSIGHASEERESLDLRFTRVERIDAESDPFVARAEQYFRTNPDQHEFHATASRKGSHEFRYARAIHRSSLASIQREQLTDFGSGALEPGFADPVVAILSVGRLSGFAQGQLMVNRIYIFAAGVLASMLAVLVFYLILTKLILSPVRGLRRVTERVQGGDLTARASLATGDEFEELSDAFNEMLESMEVDRQRLRTMNESLDLKVEELAHANVGLYESGRLKSEFLANVSHELRTPLNAIIGFAELLEGMATGEDEDSRKRRRYLGNILDSGRSLLEMINELLDMAKIEAGRMEVNPEPTSIGDLLEGLVGIMGPQASSRGVTLAIDVDEAVGRVETDPGKLQQVLYNYLSNAIKFTPRDGRVTLSARRVTRGDNSVAVRIGVADTGPGVPEDMADTIFEKFRQLDATHTREHPGTGLGLAICRELAELLHATLSVETTPGAGATFFIEVPSIFEPEAPEPLMSGP